MLTLVHIDTVVDCILNEISGDNEGLQFPKIEPTYNISVGQLSKLVRFEKAAEFGVGRWVPLWSVHFTQRTKATYLPVVLVTNCQCLLTKEDIC